MKNKYLNKLLNFKIILFVLFTISSIFAYRSEFIMFKGIDKIAEITEGKLNIRKMRIALMKAVDEIDIPNYMSSFYETPVIDISMSQKALESINQIINKATSYQDTYLTAPYMLPIHENDFTDESKIKVIYDGEEFNAKIKIQGKADEHFTDRKRSFAIKFSKEKLLNNMREIALIILDEQDINTIFSYYMVDKYLNFDVNSKLVRLRINGVDQGLYLLEEKLRKELLEKNGLTGTDVLVPYAMWTSQTSTTHNHLYSHNISSVVLKNYSNLNNGQLLKYKELYKSVKYDDLSKLVDIDKFARLEALRMLHADKHAANGDNFKLLYQNSTGKFLPFYRSESVIGALESYAASEVYTYDSIAKDLHIMEILTKNNDFRNLRNKYLFEILEDQDELLNFYNDNLINYIDAVDEDNSNLLSQRDYIYRVESSFKILKNNFELIRKYLTFGRMYSLLTSISPKEYILEIDADVNSYTKIDEIHFASAISEDISVLVYDFQSGIEQKLKLYELNNFFKNQQFILSLDENLEVSKNQSKYRLIFSENIIVDDFKIKFTNTITGNPIKQIDNYYRYVETPSDFSFTYLKNDINLFLSKHPNFSIDDNNNITLNKRLYEVYENLILPMGYNLIINEGTQINIQNDTSILIYGGIEINGSESNPVIIKNLNSAKSFGAIIALGGNKSSVKISYLDLSGGSEAFINGIYGSGALSLYSHDNVMISNSDFHNNYADDALNVKNSKFKIYNNRFTNNFADHIDIDYSKGTVQNNSFLVESKSEDFKTILSDNGDGLDLSGSYVIVRNNIFKNFSDKGLSIGEASSALIENNYFIDNRSAITAKDQSRVYLYSNNYENNQINIEMFQKKIFFDTPTVFNINEIHSNNKIMNDSSDIFRSSIKEDSSLINLTDIDQILTYLELYEWEQY